MYDWVERYSLLLVWRKIHFKQARVTREQWPKEVQKSYSRWKGTKKQDNWSVDQEGQEETL